MVRSPSVMPAWKQIVACLLLAVVAGAAWYAYQSPQSIGLAREQAGSPGEGTAAATGPSRIPGLMGGGAVNVITAPVETDQGGETIVALGTAKAARSVTIFPQVTGMVTELLFTPGQEVQAGAVLIRLEEDEQKVAVERAHVALDQARETLERSQTLAKSKTISDVALSEAESAVQLAEIEVKSAEIALQRRSVAAPFSGVTGLTDISVGDLVTPSTEIVTLDDVSTIRIGFEVPERWAARIALDQPISATAQGLPGSEFSGRIVAIDNRIDETTRTLRLEAELANEGNALKAGMAANVQLRFETDRQLAVPTLAVQWDRRGSFVWKIAEGAARRAEIAIIRRQSGMVIVQGEIEAGDLVVVEGIQRLREGAKVADVGESPTIVDDGGAAAGQAPAAGVPAVSGAGDPVKARS
jgi:RND family efflux transporter MFP subunit